MFANQSKTGIGPESVTMTKRQSFDSCRGFRKTLIPDICYNYGSLHQRTQHSNVSKDVTQLAVRCICVYKMSKMNIQNISARHQLNNMWVVSTSKYGQLREEARKKAFRAATVPLSPKPQALDDPTTRHSRTYLCVVRATHTTSESYTPAGTAPLGTAPQALITHTGPACFHVGSHSTIFQDIYWTTANIRNDRIVYYKND